MNERIRLLWAECVIKHTKDPMNWQTVADEFAELIVKECASMARVFHSNEYDFTGDLELHEFMLKHFGVKDES